jgi:hypothetical protein
MATVQKSEIRGYSFEDGMYCRECLGAEQEAGALSVDIITKKVAEENEEADFCDKCRKRIA